MRGVSGGTSWNIGKKKGDGSDLIIDINYLLAGGITIKEHLPYQKGKESGSSILLVLWGRIERSH